MTTVASSSDDSFRAGGGLNPSSAPFVPSAKVPNTQDRRLSLMRPLQTVDLAAISRSMGTASTAPRTSILSPDSGYMTGVEGDAAKVKAVKGSGAAGRSDGTDNWRIKSALKRGSSANLLSSSSASGAGKGLSPRFADAEDDDQNANSGEESPVGPRFGRALSADNIRSAQTLRNASSPRSAVSPNGTHKLMIFQALQQQQRQIMQQIQLNQQLIEIIGSSPTSDAPSSAVSSAYSSLFAASPLSAPLDHDFPTPLTAGSESFPSWTSRSQGAKSNKSQRPTPTKLKSSGASKDSRDVEASPEEIEKIAAEKGLNSKEFDLKPGKARFFVIKSYTEEDVQKSLQHGIWTSTALGNKRLDQAFQEFKDEGPIYLLFSVNGSGQFCGFGEMTTSVDYESDSKVWAQDEKWQGSFQVKWHFVKDVPFAAMKHVILENTNDKKTIAASRDTQEILYDAGIEAIKVLATHRATSSLLQRGRAAKESGRSGNMSPNRRSKPKN